MKNIFSALAFLLLFSSFLAGCTNDDLTLLYEEQAPGKVIIRGYSALQDSVQIFANGKLLEIGTQTAFKGDIEKNYEFVYYNNKPEVVEIVSKVSGSVLRSYSFTATMPIDTLSFYAKDGIWIDNVLSFEPGILSGTGRTGYRFIFPTLNKYSNSGYDGAIDAIIKKTNGQVLGIAENITKESFSTYVEFAFAPPPIINVELVKHGTTESYITGRQVIVQMVMQNNKSKLLVLDEKVNEGGTFAGVEGTINLVDFFDF